MRGAGRFGKQGGEEGVAVDHALAAQCILGKELTLS